MDKNPMKAPLVNPAFWGYQPVPSSNTAAYGLVTTKTRWLPAAKKKSLSDFEVQLVT